MLKNFTDADMTQCIGCNHCTVLKRGGRTKRPHTCHVTLHPSEPPSPGRLYKLFNVLKSVTPPEVWKKYRKPGGYTYLTHFRPKPKPATPTRISVTPPPNMVQWRKELMSKFKLHSESPRAVTKAVHGIDVMLRPLPPTILSKIEPLKDCPNIDEIENKHRAIDLAKGTNLRLGGRGRSFGLLMQLKPIEVSEELEETEPLRAMSLKTVTNIQLLEDYNNDE